MYGAKLVYVTYIRFKKGGFFDMAEAAMAAYGSMIGVMIALAVITFALRGRGHKAADSSRPE